MPREDLLATDKEKTRAKAEIHRFLTRLAVFAALCWVLFGVVFGLAVVPGSAMAPRLCGGDLVLFSRFERGTAAGQVVLYRQDGTLRLGRIAARGGDTVTVTDTGALIINGSTVAEPDITTPTQPVEGGPDYPVTLAEGELFLLCDARTTGADSRLYGPIPQRQVLGTALAALRRSCDAFDGGRLEIVRAEGDILHYRRVGVVQTAEIILNRGPHLIAEEAFGKNTEVNPGGFTVLVEDNHPEHVGYFSVY